MLLNDHHAAGTSAAKAAASGVAMTTVGVSDGGGRQHKRPKWRRHRGGEWSLRPGMILPFIPTISLISSDHLSTVRCS